MLSYNKSKNLCVRFVMPDARSVCSYENFKFSNYTTYRLGGGARRAYFPRNFAEARAAFDIAKQDGVTHFVLANGSNVLASDSDYGGDVICTRRLSAIVRVDEAGRVGHGEALSQRKPATRLHEAGVALGNSNGKARRDEPALVRGQGDVLVGPEVKSGVAGIGIARELDRGVEALDGQRDLVVSH